MAWSISSFDLKFFFFFLVVTFDLTRCIEFNVRKKKGNNGFLHLLSCFNFFSCHNLSISYVTLILHECMYFTSSYQISEKIRKIIYIFWEIWVLFVNSVLEMMIHSIWLMPNSPNLCKTQCILDDICLTPCFAFVWFQFPLFHVPKTCKQSFF